MQEDEGATNDTWVQLELMEHLDHVMIMFCSLPPVETLGTDRKAFRLLNDVFSAFDDEVRRLKVKRRLIALSLCVQLSRS